MYASHWITCYRSLAFNNGNFHCSSAFTTASTEKAHITKAILSKPTPDYLYFSIRISYDFPIFYLPFATTYRFNCIGLNTVFARNRRTIYRGNNSFFDLNFITVLTAAIAFINYYLFYVIYTRSSILVKNTS